MLRDKIQLEFYSDFDKQVIKGTVVVKVDEVTTITAVGQVRLNKPVLLKDLASMAFLLEAEVQKSLNQILEKAEKTRNAIFQISPEDDDRFRY